MGASSREDQMGKRTEGQVAPGQPHGAQPFFRKRKKAYHRAYARGTMNLEVLRFISDYQQRLMLEAIANKWFLAFKNDLTKPLPTMFGLLDVIGTRQG